MTLTVTNTNTGLAIKPSNEFEDDYVGKSMGALGSWQLIFCTFCALSRMISTFNILSVLFLTPKTHFLCVAFENNTKEVKNSTCYDDCKEYVYDDGIFNKSIISEYGLICERAWLVSLVQSALMFGLVVGISSFGWLSDRFGRSKALILSAFANIAFMIAIPFSTDYWTFIVLRFLTGFTSGGIMAITVVFTLEMVGQKYREVAGTMAIIFDGPTEALLPVFAYYTNTWNDYMLSYAGVSVVIFMTLLSIPETPRWLLVNGRMKEAVELLTRAAKFNKLSTSSIKDHVEKAYQELKLKKLNSRNISILDLFRNRELRLTTISSIILWFVAGVCFYGINQYMSIVGTNLYVVVAILGVSQLPAYPITMFITKFFGRKPSTIATHLTIGLSMVVLIFIPENSWPSTIIGIIGATAATTNFTVIYIYVTELYPTSMRNMGFGVSSSASKFGAMLAPFIANIRPIWIASLIFAVLPIVAAGFCLLLPETKGRKLQDTLE